jgi:flagellin-like hook-associated protein FlgL
MNGSATGSLHDESKSSVPNIRITQEPIFMKTIPLVLLAFLLATVSYSQQRESFDVITYVSPIRWKKTSTYNVISFAITDNTKGTYSQITVNKSTVGKGSLAADFQSEWEALIVKPYKPVETPTFVPAASVNGWDILSGSAPFRFNGGRSAAVLLTMSGYGRRMSVVIVTNTVDHHPAIDEFLSSIEPQTLETVETPGGNSASHPSDADAAYPLWEN